MDSITQFVLGAAVGEATLKKHGTVDKSKSFGLGAILLGGAVGTIPDLDVFLAPFLDGPDALAAHRGLSHSFFLGTLLAFPLAYLFSRLFRKKEICLKRWTLFAWLGLITHIMLDCLTMYGTQALQPFSNYLISIGSIFIIDPLYTLPLLFCMLWGLWRSRGDRPISLSGVRLGLALSTAYLAFSLFSKYTVLPRFEESWAAKGIESRRMITVTTPFNCLLWYAYVDTGTEVWVADCSLFDPKDRAIRWQKVPKNIELYPGFGEGKADKVLLWFSQGFYRFEIQDGKPVVIDLRFGRLKGWLTPQDPTGKDYIFRYKMKPETSTGPFEDFTAPPPEGGFGQFPWGLMWRRMWGKD